MVILDGKRYFAGRLSLCSTLYLIGQARLAPYVQSPPSKVTFIRAAQIPVHLATLIRVFVDLVKPCSLTH
jgi:hypothetical protein